MIVKMFPRFQRRMMKNEPKWLCWAIIALICTTAFGGDLAKSEGAKSNDLYAQISQAYLDGNWDELEKVLGDSSKEIEALSSAQQADAAYVRGVLAQCQTAWWNQCKKGKKVEIRPVVWGHTLKLWFDPAGKDAVEMKSVGAVKVLSVTWPVADMDNPEHAEHGYSKGDLCNLGAWNTIGIAMVWSQISAQALANRSGDDKLRLDRYQEFRGHLAGLYYGTPKARRWGLFLYLLSWMDKYSQMPTVGSRKAAGAMFLAEILANPAKYPSIPLPGDPERRRGRGKTGRARPRQDRKAWLDNRRRQGPARGDQRALPPRMRPAFCRPKRPHCPTSSPFHWTLKPINRCVSSATPG